MNRVRVATVTLTVAAVLFVRSGVASASPGSPSAPQFEWLPDFLYPAWQFIWAFGYLLENGVNPFTGNPWSYPAG